MKTRFEQALSLFRFGSTSDSISVFLVENRKLVTLRLITDVMTHFKVCDLNVFMQDDRMCFHDLFQCMF